MKMLSYFPEQQLYFAPQADDSHIGTNCYGHIQEFWPDTGGTGALLENAFARLQ
jgi:hypothetical protein